MTITEARPTIHLDQPEHAIEGPLTEHPAREMITEFFSSRGLQMPKSFHLENRIGQIIFEDKPPIKEKAPSIKRLSVFIFQDIENATAEIDTHGKDSIGWAKHGRGVIKHEEDTLEVETKIRKMLSQVYPKPAEPKRTSEV